MPIDVASQTYKVGNTTYDVRSGRVVSGTPEPYSPFTPPAAPTAAPTIAPAVVSARQASEKASKATADYTTIQTQRTQQQQRLSAEKAAQKPTEKQEQQEEPLTLALEDANGGIRQQTIYNPSINRRQIQALVSGGWEPVQGTVPGGIGPDTTVDEVAQAETQDKEYTDLVGELDNIRTALSDSQKAYVDSIKGVYETRKTQMADVNKREQAALAAFGISSGSVQRTASFGGILSEQERQGISRLKELDVEEKQLISEAELAHTQNDYKILTEKIDLYNKKREEKSKVLAEVQKAALEQRKKAQEQQRKASVGVAVADLMRQGVTDPKTLIDYLNVDSAGNLVGDVSADELKTILDTFNGGGEAKDIGEIVKSIGKNMAPAEVIDAVSKAPTLAEAVKAAGQYLQDVPTGGVVGEYLFYKKQAEASGQVPLSFDEYQTRDANRKRPVTNVYGGGGLPSSILTKVTTVAQGFDDDPIVKRYATAREGFTFAQSIPDDTTNPADQQGFIYAFAKAMDPDSVVREGEYATVQKYAQSWAQTYGFSAARVFSNTKFLSSQSIANMRATMEKKYRSQESSYRNFRTQQEAKINNLTGGADGADYLTDHTGSLAEEIVQTEDTAMKKVVSHLSSAGEAAKNAVRQMVGDGKTYIEIAQILGI